MTGEDRAQRPVDAMLRSAAGRISFHMPGHKGRAPFPEDDPYRLDTTELPNTDDLWQPGDAIKSAEDRYARAAGAAETLFLTGGSTAGVHAMLQLWAREGDTVILPRNAHLSAVNACILGGLGIRWIPVTSTADGYVYIREEDVLAALEACPHARTLLLTRPDYSGGCIPLERIVRAAHGLGIRVAVDEAHGAHLPWMEGPRSSGEYGVDAWVQSTHKTLPALTGTAVLHLRDGADRPRAMRLLHREQSSSPNYLLVRSIDDAEAWMEQHGRDCLRRLTGQGRNLRGKLPSYGYLDAQSGWRASGYDFDPTRLVIGAPQGGDALAEALRARGIDVEMTDDAHAVLILTAMNTEEDLAALDTALSEIRPTAERQKEAVRLLPLPEQKMTVRAAAMAISETVPLHRAAGRVAAESAGFYPPGIPLVVPGEVITEEVCECLMNVRPESRFGLEREGIRCVV